jgi:hypothetical protein
MYDACYPNKVFEEKLSGKHLEEEDNFRTTTFMLTE